MDLRRLEQFVAVAREGGFGRAARRLAISQPALTRSIGVLEEELSVRLFDRGPRGAAMTAAGEKLLPHALSILNEASRAVAELDPGHAGAEGQVRIGASPSFLSSVMPRAIATLLARAPGVNVQVTTGTREAMAAKLAARDLDAALCIVPEFLMMTREETADLTFEELGSELIEPHVAAAHRLLGRRLELADVAEERWAVPFELSLSYRFTSLFFRSGLSAPQQALNSASLAVIRAATAATDLIAMLPQADAAADVAAGRLAPLDLPELRLGFTAGLMLRRATGAPSRLLRLVGEVLRDAVRNG